MRLGLVHTYADLPERLYAAVPPVPVRDPRLIVFNRPLARELGLDVDLVAQHAAGMLSGNELPQDARPIAMAYAGHQFGNFVPRLGDGRALLLGELRDADGQLRDLQLKGSGRTPFSRGGDGRAALGPMLREYLVSEAMHHLGVPTTRALAVVATGEQVRRDGPQPGAILTRIAASHVRVGSFEYLAARNDGEGLRLLLDYVIARHYPQAADAAIPALAVLAAVAERQASLIAQWMQLGFIHGVMNTDNMAISGETIDYGPCAFMDHFDPHTVFSSIDEHGRYAYANQPTIAQWNLARLAETLLPLIDSDEKSAITQALGIIEPFIERFDAHYLMGMRAKLGLFAAQETDHALIRRLLGLMQAARADHTQSFRHLADAALDSGQAGDFLALFEASAEAREWLEAWRARTAGEAQPAVERAAAMRRVNPAVIPRNHHVEAALNAAAERGDVGPFTTLLEILQRPFDDQPAGSVYLLPPLPSERVLATFCGT
jgi:uncharacterized protein YdiU (UPF0061 family)